ncbi:MAG: LytTR family transcriptional regulator DNA-binding domain-containing protein [Lentimicrobiaceae bacterium]|nr:LytTR family transcriptional regulator DNA-binding domain-containing protein [Lentimicrobiaceae bacterium]
MKPVTCFAFVQNATLEKKVIDCLSRFKSIQFFGFVNQRVDFLERMSYFRPEILILDLSQRKNEETDILEMIHKPPIILGIISSKENTQFWLDKGLFDVVPAQFNNELLVRKIYKIIRIISDINNNYQFEPVAAESPIPYPYKPPKPSFQSKENDSFFIRYQKVTTKIKTGIITVITKENKFLAIETSTNQLYFHESTIKASALKLPAFLIRINNATIINLHYIDKIQKDRVYLGERMFRISRSYFYQFKNALEALQQQE